MYSYENSLLGRCQRTHLFRRWFHQRERNLLGSLGAHIRIHQGSLHKMLVQRSLRCQQHTHQYQGRRSIEHVIDAVKFGNSSISETGLKSFWADKSSNSAWKNRSVQINTTENNILNDKGRTSW